MAILHRYSIALPERLDANNLEMPLAARDRINGTPGVIGFTMRTDRVAWKLPNSDVRQEAQRVMVEVDTTAVDAADANTVLAAMTTIANDLGKLFGATNVYMARWAIENRVVTVA